MLDQSIFKARRAALMQQLVDNSVVIIPGGSEQIRNNDVEHPFRQDSSFFYLTGFDEPDAFLVLCPKRSEGEYLLFVRPKDKTMEIWNGYRAGPQGAVDDYEADEAFENEDIDQVIPELLANTDAIYASFGHDTEFDQQVMHFVNQVKKQARKGVSAPSTFIDVADLINEMRLNMMDLTARTYLAEQREKFFDGEQVDQAEGYVPPEE